MDVRANIEAEIAKISGEINEQRQNMRSRVQRYAENEELDFANATKSAQARVDQLRIDLRDLINREAMDASLTNPLVGKKVFRTKWTRSTRFGGPDYTATKEYGIVEVVTSQTVQPQPKTGWRRLPIGTVAVRLLGANGAPRKTLEKLELRTEMQASDKAKNLFKDSTISEGEYQRWLDRYWTVMAD